MPFIWILTGYKSRDTSDESQVIFRNPHSEFNKSFHHPARQSSVFCGARTGHTLTQMLHSVQVSLSTVTTSLIMLMAITGHKSIHPPHPVHLFVSIVTILYPFLNFSFFQDITTEYTEKIISGASVVSYCSLYQAEGLWFTGSLSLLTTVFIASILWKLCNALLNLSLNPSACW